VGGHADEAGLSIAGLDGFADLELPLPAALINLPEGKFNAFVVHIGTPRGVRFRDKATPEPGESADQNRPVLELTNDLGAGNYLQRNITTWRALAGWRHVMPRYYFDIKDGHGLVDPAGLECKNDSDAIERARVVAIGVSLDKPAVDPTRYISVINDARQEIFQAAVYSKPSAK
jgi:hypothetical protein